MTLVRIYDGWMMLMFVIVHHLQPRALIVLICRKEASISGP